MHAIAQAAGVALDTVYAAVGPKPVLFRLLVETAISRTQEPVPALERDYVRAIRAEPDPARKLMYARRSGASSSGWPPGPGPPAGRGRDPELRALWQEIAERQRGQHGPARRRAGRHRGRCGPSCRWPRPPMCCGR